MRKILYLSLFLILTVSCLKSKINPPEINPLDNFDWKTTKSVPVNITSDNDVQAPVYIYHKNKMVAAGYTPFTEKITVPKACDELIITTMPLPYDILYKSKSAATKADDKYITKVGVENGGTVNAKVSDKTHIDLHDYLYTQWAGWKLGGFTWEAFVPWWNTSGGAQGQSTITIYENQKPEYNEDGSVKFIYHTCSWDQCDKGGESSGGVEEPVQFETMGTYIFEDLFPSLGDFDMNDCVVEERKKAIMSKHNTVESCEILLSVNALGSGSGIGMAIYMPEIVKQRVKKSIEMWIVDDGKEIPYNCPNSECFTIDKDGLEENQKELVIPISENILSLLKDTPGGSYFNTVENGRKGSPLKIKIKMEFNSNQISYSEFKTDIFIMPYHKSTGASAQRGREIHVADATYTSRMNTSLFNSGDDDSKVDAGKTYRAKNKYVWGIYIPIENFRHAKEKVNLSDAYSQFSGWITSGGNENQEWYKNPDSNKVWSW